MSYRDGVSDCTSRAAASVGLLDPQMHFKRGSVVGARFKSSPCTQFARIGCDEQTSAVWIGEGTERPAKVDAMSQKSIALASLKKVPLLVQG